MRVGRTDRPPADPDREALAARAFPFRTVTPSSYVEEHGADMIGFTYDDARYADPDLDAWLLEVGRLLRERPMTRPPGRSTRRLGVRRCERRRPRLRLAPSGGRASTGMARRHEGMIAVRAGSDELDQRLTLLHELAHWLGPATEAPPGSRRCTMDVRSTRIAFDLYLRHGIPPPMHCASSQAATAARSAMPSRLASRERTRCSPPIGPDLRTRPRRRWRVLVPEHPIRLGREGRWTVCVTCGQRVVGGNLARVRRARRPMRHVLMTAAASRRSAGARPTRRSVPAPVPQPLRGGDASGVRGKTCAMRCFARDRRSRRGRRRSRRRAADGALGGIGRRHPRRRRRCRP